MLLEASQSEALLSGGVYHHTQEFNVKVQKSYVCNVAL